MANKTFTDLVIGDKIQVIDKFYLVTSKINKNGAVSVHEMRTGQEGSIDNTMKFKYMGHVNDKVDCITDNEDCCGQGCDKSEEE